MVKKKIKTILISQPKPATEKSPYFDLADKMKLTIDFRPFIHVEAVDVKEFPYSEDRHFKIYSCYSYISYGSRSLLPHGRGDEI